MGHGCHSCGSPNDCSCPHNLMGIHNYGWSSIGHVIKHLIREHGETNTRDAFAIVIKSIADNARRETPEARVREGVLAQQELDKL